MSSYTEELKEAPVGMTKTKSRLVRGHRFVLFFSMRIVDSPPSSFLEFASRGMRKKCTRQPRQRPFPHLPPSSVSFV